MAAFTILSAIEEEKWVEQFLKELSSQEHKLVRKIFIEFIHRYVI